ncbi:SH3 domain-containing protein [Streptomyces telluris]|uniref:SH3b domain-containing protein n=1 Tax=Streptomyces telluris TaxID=2720021 RepID=A0A9X2LQA6_9ACTN|nr:hypothetical protein [Streptomyces telluris]MCQ8773645.1 hypothetical protein [Streptomyces telluris]NJP79768.1 hypothetical protein [Streptomyces telluris]
MKRKLALTVGTAAIAGGSLLGFTPAAGATTTAAAQSPSGTAVVTSASAEAPLAACKAQAKEQVLIRAKATTDSGINGTIPQGKTVSCGETKKGGSYDACHKKDNHWLYVTYNGHKGWSPKACMVKR